MSNHIADVGKMVPSCQTCRWWMDGVRDMDGSIDDCGGWGDCRKRAPTHNPNPENTDFPRSYQDDWCGEHTPKDATT